MAEQSEASLEGLPPARLGVGWPGWTARLLGVRWSEAAVAILAVAFAVVALWITLDADFLAHPGWLAVQKADLILGPIGVGLYWRLRRPDNRLGLFLIVLGLLGVVYILQSTTPPILFGIGILVENAIYLMTEVVILAFPNGRLGGIPERMILAGALVVSLVGVVFTLTSPQLAPEGSISGCGTVCPENGLAIWPPPSWAAQLLDISRVSIVAVALATAGLLCWRFLTGTTPRRRALAIGTPVALIFLLTQATYNTVSLLSPNGASPSAQPVQNAIQWTFAGARAAIWYGFLLALVAAELFAGRALRELVRNSLGRPSFRELEGMLRRPLGDPGLRLGFWRPSTREWADADDAPLEPPRPEQQLTKIERDGHTVAQIVHDKQLAEDPELLRVAGTVSLLALENAELEAAWEGSLRALAESRARLTKASDQERRKLERDLHDGAQQRILGALVRLSSADELATDNPDLQRKLTATRRELEGAIDELRDLARGIYPAVLTEGGLPEALRSIAHRSPERISLQATDGRFPPEIETALYFCCLEAVQNASKHAGPEAHISIRLYTRADELRLEVRDTGPGFDPTTAHDGLGLQSMRDRVGAVGGQVEIMRQPGGGAIVIARAPLDNPCSSISQPDLP